MRISKILVRENILRRFVEINLLSPQKRNIYQKTDVKLAEVIHF